MSIRIRRYRRLSIVKALKEPDPVFVIETTEVLPDLVVGRL